MKTRKLKPNVFLQVAIKLLDMKVNLTKYLYVFPAVLLVFGFIYHLILTSGGNFIFNMDNARDMIDVRDIVVLKHLRLIGPTSAIEGFFNGPGWYYLLSIPFVITSGNPYASIVLMNVLWLIGGIFLIKLLKPFGLIPSLFGTTLWVSSNYITLDTVYAFNPSPVLFLMPFFVYLWDKFLHSEKLIFGAASFFLAGLFFNFEMAFGFLMPAVAFASLLLCGKVKLLFKKNFWVSTSFFIFTLLPQVFFDLRHNFIMTNSFVNYLNSDGKSFDLVRRFNELYVTYKNVYYSTLMNWQLLAKITLLLLMPLFIKFFINKKIVFNQVLIINFTLIFIPMLTYLLIPINVNLWHLAGSVAAAIIFFSVALSHFLKINYLSKVIGVFFCLAVLIFGFYNLNFFENTFNRPENKDPAVYANEIKAIDYVYQKANGKNFKVYTYIPSVIDYPYQYLFWQYGQKKYGFLPEDYAYLPNKPPYIKNKEKFSNGVNPPGSGLVFLIKEQNRPDLKDLWENSFKHLPLINREMIGPWEVEIRDEK